MTGTFGSSAAEYPCSTCLVKKNNIHNLYTSYEDRNYQNMHGLMTDVKNGIKTAKDTSVQPIEVQFLNFSLTAALFFINHL